MHIRKPTYKKEDVDCKLCTEYRGKNIPAPMMCARSSRNALKPVPLPIGMQSTP